MDTYAIHCRRCHRNGRVQLDVVLWWADGVHEEWGVGAESDEGEPPEPVFEEPLAGLPPTLCPPCRVTR